MKYKYLGGLSAEKINGEEVILVNDKIYDFDPNSKRVQTLIKLGFLKKIEEKITIENNSKKGQK